MSQNLSQTPKTAAIVEKITTVHDEKAKAMEKNTIIKIARSPAQKCQVAPYVLALYINTS